MPSDTLATNDRRTWREFRESKLLWWINQTLHLFGWSIVLEGSEDSEDFLAYPARVSFRGFSEKVTDDGYRELTKHIQENIDQLVKDTSQ